MHQILFITKNTVAFLGIMTSTLMWKSFIICKIPYLRYSDGSKSSFLLGGETDAKKKGTGFFESITRPV